nr:ATP-binding protein [Chryseosolibacter indicus]
MLSFFLGAAILVYLILVDISKSNYYKKQLEKARDHAEELSKIKQRFLANMSHEIRTPLQSIIGFAEQLRSHANKDHTEAVSAIHSSSEHLLHIVNEVLDYSRISSGSFTLSKEKFRLIQLVKEVESAMRIQADRKSLSFILDTEKTSDYNLLGDPFRLRQILYNLLGNAIKFTHQGFIKLTVKTIEIDDCIQCIFEIKDTGIGMTNDELKTIFNQFEQANSQITKTYGGTGLGLTIVKSLIEVQNGELEVMSEPGVGSTFRISLGFDKATEIPQQKAQHAEAHSIAFNGKILVVDDDAMILKLCGLILKKNNISHTAFNEAEDLLRTVKDPEVSHILIDIRMPKMNGVELCRALKKVYSEGVKFIALTAHVLPEERQSLIQQGFNTVLAKPFHENELLTAIGVTPIEKRFIEEMPDFSSLKKMTMGDDALFYSVMQQFVEESEYDIQKLQSQVEQENKKGIREVVHKLAGRLGQLGVHNLSTRFRDLELRIVEGAGYNELTDDLIDVIQGTKELLNSIRMNTLAHSN